MTCRWVFIVPRCLKLINIVLFSYILLAFVYWANRRIIENNCDEDYCCEKKRNEKKYLVSSNEILILLNNMRFVHYRT